MTRNVSHSISGNNEHAAVAGHAQAEALVQGGEDRRAARSGPRDKAHRTRATEARARRVTGFCGEDERNFWRAHLPRVETVIKERGLD